MGGREGQNFHGQVVCCLGMRGSEIHRLLDQAQVLPSKQLGQNFLVDSSVAEWIVSQLDLNAGDTVVEVGPGTGALSEHVIGVAKRVLLIEFDKRLAEMLRKRYENRDDVEVVHADGAKFDRRLLFKHRPVKFLGNLPYSSGGAILRNLLSAPHPFSRGVIMLQKEVIDRLCAGPGTKAYGILSLRMQVNWEVFPLKVVPPEVFHPRPTIDSEVALLLPRRFEEVSVFDRRLFDELVRRGFAQRRKQLAKQLPAGVDWRDVAQQMGLSSTVRAEELTLFQWIELATKYDQHPLRNSAQEVEELFDVVDEEDRPVAKATRAEVHEKGLLHRAVHVFILNRNGDLWIQKRSVLKDMNPGLWDSSVSGHLDQGEDYEAAALREISEEVGISDVEPVDLKHVLKVGPSERNGFEHVHLYMLWHRGSLSFPASEIESMIAFPMDELALWMTNAPEDFSPAFVELFRLFRRSQSFS